MRGSLQARWRLLHERITKAARAAGRPPEAIRLVAVSKTFGPDAIAEALDAGQHAFGENYVQEALAKIESLRTRADTAPEWHFIGPIQSNKTRAIAEHFDWVQSVDRVKIAQRLSEQRPASLPALNLLLQVNISGEATKSGASPDRAAELAAAIAALPRVQLRGLMAIPEPEHDVGRQRAAFAALRRLFEAIVAQGVPVDTLSMGMSGDFEAAIAEGSTMVRIGTAIFGEREAVHG
jgi:pyridoxal phosphate enzyme (YggS family)